MRPLRQPEEDRGATRGHSQGHGQISCDSSTLDEHTEAERQGPTRLA